MVASEITDVINADNASPSPALGCSSSVPCSICFDLVNDDGDRSIAKLHCGHKFHLDCIGSAFNTKGTMQCPNCRKVESGRWLFADSSAHAISETSARDWMPNEGTHDLSYPRRPFGGFHWCPISGFMIHSSIEEAEPSLNTFANFQAHHAVIIEHTAAPSSAPSSISYFRPSEHVGNSNFHHPLNSISTPRNNLRATNIQHPSWGWNCHFLPYNADRDYIGHGNLAPVNPVTLRSTHIQADSVGRSPSFLHPLHYTQQFDGAMSLSVVLPPVTNRPNHRGSRGFYVHEPECSYNYTHETDHTPHVPIIRGSFHHRFSSNRTHWS